MRFFNTVGPVVSEDHYCVSPLDRVDLDHILALVRDQSYFVLHAPRQTGKTSVLFALRDLLNGGDAGECRCAYVSVESARAAGQDVAQAMGAIASEIAREAEDAFGDEATAQAAREFDIERRPFTALSELLRVWSKADPKRLVLLLDDMDALVGDSLISTLRQIRASYVHRPAAFPQSILLCGVGDVRDYGIRAGPDNEVVTSGSVFNIKARVFRLPDFTRSEVAALLGQHTAETGQEFASDAIAAVWEQTRGQPGLVNALAREMCFSSGKPRERGGPLEEADVFAAREEVILRRGVHLAGVIDSLREPRVRRVVTPLLSGGDGYYDLRDFDYVRELGLIADDDRALRIANAIYAEAIPRALTRMLESEIPKEETDRFVDATGALDMDAALAAFQELLAEDAERWIGLAQYPAAGPQLVLQVFLQRIVEGRGRIERECELANRRVDLVVVWPIGTESAQRIAVVYKTVGKGREFEWEVERGLAGRDGGLHERQRRRRRAPGRFRRPRGNELGGEDLPGRTRVGGCPRHRVGGMTGVVEVRDLDCAVVAAAPVASEPIRTDRTRMTAVEGPAPDQRCARGTYA